MRLGVDISILNQKGTPAFYSDTFANRPAFGFAGRVFISTDTGAIYEDTGTSWTLIADAGAGTTGTLQQVTTNGNTTTNTVQLLSGAQLQINNGASSSHYYYENASAYSGSTTFAVMGNYTTGGGLRFEVNNNNDSFILNADYTALFIGNVTAPNLTLSTFTAGSVLFAGASGLLSQKNANFFWDNTNNRLGINNASPGAPLDVHGTGTAAQFNGTGTNNAYTVYQNAGVSKWRIGNTYNAGTNSFDIYDSVNALTVLSITNNQSFTFFGTNNSQFSFSNGKLSSTRTGPSINLTISAENRQTPAVNVGSSYGFYGGAAGTDPIAEMYGAWEGSSVNNSFWSLYTMLSGSKTEKLRVTSAGYFGILTTTPVYPLDVNGAARANDIIAGGSTFAYDGTLRTRTAANVNTNLFNANGFSYITGGNFGVGSITDNGLAALQVTGKIRASGAINMNTVDAVFNTGTTTIFTITNEINSHYLVTGHDPNTSVIYASAIVIVNVTGNISAVINIATSGGLTWTGSGQSVQSVNSGVAANGRSSIIRMR